eukprot:TRINITY_DN21638_c0_g1_i1.p1 TRINITY_DN21638_c0_g1~~TRINITY_DN21638_c0_g1_i1.p1  ORF type:complete len:1702 (-),score=242.33 TRINITY_DN21638_c0_g1_i1:568-5673(-)
MVARNTGGPVGDVLGNLTINEHGDEPGCCSDINCDETRIRTQQEMCNHFLPILREHGRTISKGGRRLARPAKHAEEVLTIINGEIVAKTKVADETSMVVRQESADHELYVLSADKFAKNYSLPGKDISETEPRFEELRERGFKYYDRKGELIIYQVTDKDMLFVPSGKFQVSFSSIPAPLRTGDYLVTVCPDMNEIYMSRHATIYNDDGQLFPSQGVRSQQEMCQHFIPILKKRGTIVRKMGRRLARPAVLGENVLTVINGEVVAKTVITDDTSMVIRQESADHELYALSEEKFKMNYTACAEISESEPGFQELSDRGFKYYERKGQLLIYQVTEEDMEFVSGGKFQVSFSSIPQPLRVGDYLVTVYPDMKEVYMTRHATIYNDDGQLYQPRGVRTQAEMQSHFFPIMEERGVRMRRAGQRLLRPAKKGEEVLTIIDSEVVAKTVVLDDTSMVVQEESADRELYALDQKTFEASYELPGLEITGSGVEYDALRSRGFKHYMKKKGMVLIYRVTKEDMEFVSCGKFQAPWSVIPQPLRIGDYLVTKLPEMDVIYLSRNAEQIYFSSENLEVHYVFASPFNSQPLAIDAELEGLRTSGAVVRLTCATRENLVHLKKAWNGTSASVLHISCHTRLDPATSQPHIVLEDVCGRAQTVTARAFLDLVIGGGVAPEVVVVSSCRSQAVAEACLQRGVRMAVAVRDGQTLLDRAARDFVFSFYGELRSHRNVRKAFIIAIESMRASRDSGVPAEASKLVLLPQEGFELNLGAERLRRGVSTTVNEDFLEVEPHVAVPLPFGTGEGGHIGPLVQPRSAVPQGGNFLLGGGGGCGFAAAQALVPKSRLEFASQTLQAFTSFRVLKVHGPRGTGKAHLAGLLAGFTALPGGRLFSGGAIVVNRDAEDGIPSQEKMCEHFIPILRSKGTRVRKGGTRLARPAKKGEEVLTVINGQMVAKVVVEDSTSMVIRQESSDHELYVLDEKKFSANYELEGKEITERGSDYDAMRDRGYKCYERKGMVLIYRVTEEDMKFVPQGKFGVAFSTSPQPVQVGDYLVTGYPDSKEIYMSRNAGQIYSSQIVRSQEEMREHFLPSITRRGKVVRRVGAWLARPARRDEEIHTIINGEVVSSVVVTDDTSMVVHAHSCDGEWYVLSAADFDKRYESPGKEIADKGHEFDTWRARGFKYHARKGMARILQVTEPDMKFVVNGCFKAKDGSKQTLQVGDYLVVDYPDVEEIYASRNADQIYEEVPLKDLVRSQDEMLDHFGPMLRLRGQLMRRIGVHAARRARRGEVIRTLIDGEIIAKATNSFDTSMVVRHETVDREMVLLSRREFIAQNKTPGYDIVEDGPQFDSLRRRGFKFYECQGQVLVHRVTEEDILFVPGKLFWTPFSSIPQPLHVGDSLVTNLPRSEYVYLCRNVDELFVPVGETTHSSNESEIEKKSCVEKLRTAVSENSDPEPYGSGETDETGEPSSPTTVPSVIDHGLKVRAELEDALRIAALSLHELAVRWYGHEGGSGGVKRRAEIKEAEHAVDSAVEDWLAVVPPGSRSLIILVDGAKYLTHDAPRELLRRLLRSHPGLHLLVTVTTAEPSRSSLLLPASKTDEVEAAAAASMAKSPPAQLDANITELHKMVPATPLTVRETAEVFFSAMMRSRQGDVLGRLLAKLGRQEAVARLEDHPLVHGLAGRLGMAAQAAERVDASVSTLDDLRLD